MDGTPSSSRLKQNSAHKGKGKGMKRPAASHAPAAAEEDDKVSLPSTAGEQQGQFEPVPVVEPTNSSAAHGAPLGAVVEPVPAPGNKKRIENQSPEVLGRRLNEHATFATLFTHSCPMAASFLDEWS